MSEATVSRDDVSALHDSLAQLRGQAVDRAASATVAVRVVYAAAGAYAVLFALAAITHFLVFKTARPDLGNMVQAIWSTRHGHFLESTTLTGHQANRLGFHVDPFLVLIRCQRHRRLKQRLARDHVITAGQILGQTPQMDPREDDLGPRGADIDADRG